MPEQETEHRVKYHRTGEPESTQSAPDAKEAGRIFRSMRGWVEQGGKGGEAEIQRRVVGPWETAAEPAKIEPKQPV